VHFIPKINNFSIPNSSIGVHMLARSNLVQHT